MLALIDGDKPHQRHPAYWAPFIVVGEGASPALTTAIKEEEQPSSPAADPEAIELTFWNSVKDSEDASVFESYLKRYPSGAFSALAKQRIMLLKSNARSGGPIPAPAYARAEGGKQ